MNTTLINQELYGKSYTEIKQALNIVEDGGGCCGWADFTEYDALEKLSDHDKENAKLIACILVDYDNTDLSRVVCNFVFETPNNTGLILGYDMKAGSGSGWSYGAFVNLNYYYDTIASVNY